MSRTPAVAVAVEHRVIFATGGGGFTMEPTNPLLDEFVLDLARARAAAAGLREPRVLFLPTASGDESAQITAFRARFGARACTAEHLSLFRVREARRPLAELVLDQDLVYVGGGSMRNLLAICGNAASRAGWSTRSSPAVPRRRSGSAS